MTQTELSEVRKLQMELETLQARLNQLESGAKRHEKTEQELREKEEFNFALFSYNPALTVVVDREGKVVRSNRAKIRSGDRLPPLGAVMYKEYASHHAIDMHRELMDCIQTGTMKCFPELKYDGKYLSITISPFPKGAIIISEDITARKQAEDDRTKLISELRRALDEVQTLRGLIPICAHCKKIREDSGFWTHIENYISKHSQADFSHTMCPECIKQYYPEFWQQKSAQNARSG